MKKSSKLLSILFGAVLLSAGLLLPAGSALCAEQVWVHGNSGEVSLSSSVIPWIGNYHQPYGLTFQVDAAKTATALFAIPTKVGDTPAWGVNTVKIRYRTVGGTITKIELYNGPARAKTFTGSYSSTPGAYSTITLPMPKKSFPYGLGVVVTTQAGPSADAVFILAGVGAEFIQ